VPRVPGDGAEDRREVSPTLKVSNHYEPTIDIHEHQKSSRSVPYFPRLDAIRQLLAAVFRLHDLRGIDDCDMRRNP
jgi:hypothetical protein